MALLTVLEHSCAHNCHWLAEAPEWHIEQSLPIIGDFFHTASNSAFAGVKPAVTSLNSTKLNKLKVQC